MPSKSALVTAVVLLVVAGCSGARPSGAADGETITALMVGNPQMVDIQRLTAENFTKRTGITVEFTILAENGLSEYPNSRISAPGCRNRSVPRSPAA